MHLSSERKMYFSLGNGKESDMTYFSLEVFTIKKRIITIACSCVFVQQAAHINPFSIFSVLRSFFRTLSHLFIQLTEKSASRVCIN
jgi:hypothetical protein